jgi:hypothetical protein
MVPLIALFVSILFALWVKSLITSAQADANLAASANAAGQVDPFPSYDRLAAEGAPARGLVLQAKPYPKGALNCGRTFEHFQVVLDVELEGAAPYEVATSLFLPRGLVSMVPGSALELRVDRKYPKRIAIIGPAGFTGPWLRSPADFLAEPP